MIGDELKWLTDFGSAGAMILISIIFLKFYSIWVKKLEDSMGSQGREVKEGMLALAESISEASKQNLYISEKNTRAFLSSSQTLVSLVSLLSQRPCLQDALQMKVQELTQQLTDALEKG